MNAFKKTQGDQMSSSTYYAELSCRAIETTDANFKSAVKRILKEVDKLEGGTSAIVAVNGQDHTVKFSLAVATDDGMEALQAVSTLARAALHASGGATPNWPTFSLSAHDTSLPDAFKVLTNA